MRRKRALTPPGRRVKGDARRLSSHAHHVELPLRCAETISLLRTKRRFRASLSPLTFPGLALDGGTTLLARPISAAQAAEKSRRETMKKAEEDVKCALCHLSRHLIRSY